MNIKGKALLAGCIALAFSNMALAEDIKVAVVGAMSRNGVEQSTPFFYSLFLLNCLKPDNKKSRRWRDFKQVQSTKDYCLIRKSSRDLFLNFAVRYGTSTTA